MRFFSCFAFAFAFVGFAAAQTQEPALKLGQPFALGQVRVIPILGNDDPNAINTISLADAYKKGLVKIDDPKTTVVSIKNNAAQPLLLLAGELIVGGHQDQIIQQDYTVVPGQTISASVFCVEPGRSGGPTSTFESTGMLAPDWIRAIISQASARVIAKDVAQYRVWAEVEAISASHGAAPGSSIAQTLYGSDFKKSVAQTVASLAAVEDKPQTIGMMLVINGRIFSVDLFPSHKNFEAFRSTLIELYSTDANLTAGDRSSGEIGSDVLESCLNAIAGSSRKQIGAVGATAWFRTVTNSILGIESTLNGRPCPLHGAYFPN